MMYKFEDGTTLWGSYVLDRKLAEVQPGAIVFIQLHRKLVTNNSGLCKTFDVLLIDSETEEVVNASLTRGGQGSVFDDWTDA